MINATFLIYLLFFWAYHLINLLKLKQNHLHQKRLFQIHVEIDIIWANGFIRVWFVASAKYIMRDAKQRECVIKGCTNIFSLLQAISNLIDNF